MGTSRGWMKVAARATGELRDVVMPSQCRGCGVWDRVVCDGCLRLLEEAPTWRAVDGASGQPLMLWSCGRYSGAHRSLVLAAKHEERVASAPLTSRVGRALGQQMAREVAWSPGEVLVVPAPSSRARERSGRLPAVEIAHALAATLAGERSVRVRVSRGTRLARGDRGQSGRSGAERRSGRAGTMRLADRSVRGHGQCVLVDDVVTTGATMREMERVLEVAPLALAAWCDVE